MEQRPQEKVRSHPVRRIYRSANPERRTTRQTDVKVTMERQIQETYTCGDSTPHRNLRSHHSHRRHHFFSPPRNQASRAVTFQEVNRSGSDTFEHFRTSDSPGTLPSYPTDEQRAQTIPIRFADEQRDDKTNTETKIKIPVKRLKTWFPEPILLPSMIPFGRIFSPESDLAFRRVTSVSSPPGRSGYSAHRERLKQEREQELLMRQQRHRQMAASTTGLHEEHLQQQTRHQQQYRSMSAVNQPTGGAEAFEEVETIILQPIGRGVQDIDSHVGSMTTLQRGPGGSMMDDRGRFIQSFAPKVSPQRTDFTRVERPSSYRPSPARQNSSPGQLYYARTRSLSPLRLESPQRTQTLIRPHSLNIRGRNVTRLSVHSARPEHNTYKTTSPEEEYERSVSIRFSTSPSFIQITPVDEIKQEHEVNGNNADSVTITDEQLVCSPKTATLLPTVTTLGLNQPNETKDNVVEDTALTDLVQTTNEMRTYCPELQQNTGSPSVMMTEHKQTAGLNRPEGSQRGVLARRGFSSTQFLNRNISNTDLTRTNVTHHSQTIHNAGLNSVPVQQNRYGTSSTLVNNPAAGSLAGSRSQLSGAPSTIIAPTSAPPQTVTGWKTDPIKRYFPDGTDPSNFGIVQDTAPVWYRPSLSREAAISILRQQPPGSFLIRDSTTFKDAFGLAVKVATLPPKVTPKSDDLQSELVRHYLIEVVHSPTKGVRLKGFASEPVFPSLAALIHQHTIDPLALPCRLILPPVPTILPSSGTAVLPPLVIGTSQPGDAQSAIDNVTSSGSVLGITPSETGSVQLDGVSRTSRGGSIPIQIGGQMASSPNVPYVTVIRDSPSATMGVMSDANQGSTFRCLMLGSIDTPQWDTELCFARAVDQLIPLTILTAADCDHGISRVRYTEVQLHVSPHDGVTIIDLQRRLFFRRHLPNHILIYCGLEPRKKEFSHPEHQLHGIVHPKIFGIVVRKGISECTTHVFSECDPLHPAEEIVRHIRTTYPHMNMR